ncbi:hypothetical protein QTP70_034348, partial [Hemibagrus guttatus]
MGKGTRLSPESDTLEGTPGQSVKTPSPSLPTRPDVHNKPEPSPPIPPLDIKGALGYIVHSLLDSQ